MKKLFILVTFISSMIMSSLAHAEWTKVAKVSGGDAIFYVDMERIRRHEGKVYYWQLTDYAKPGYNGTMSSKIYIEAECRLFRTRWLNQTYYKGPMASGKTLHENNTPQKDWVYPSPNSAGEGVLKVVCNHKSMQ